MTYQPRTAPILFAGHPQGLRLVINGPQGRIVNREVRVGETIDVVPGLALGVDAFWLRAIQEDRPFIVPPPQRDRAAGESFAMIRLEVATGAHVQTRWLRFNAYALPSEQYAYPGRLVYLPERFQLPDGSVVEVLFSRVAHPLPAPIALSEFELDTHLGGYSGSPSTIRNYVSRLRFQDQGEWTEPVAIAVNQPTHFGGYWYFQSMWDRPPPNSPEGGMNYTGLGVGNRRGVYVQLFGCCLSVAGMIFAFYIKPVVQRRSREQSMARVTAAHDSPDEFGSAPAAVEALGVSYTVSTGSLS
jgi:hypothetical protein